MIEHLRGERISDAARQYALSMAYICTRRAASYPASREEEAALLRREAETWRALADGAHPGALTDEQREWLERDG
ncbi:MAG TPA: hypothetical protein VF613_06780 [Longimicrobium sp.]